MISLTVQTELLLFFAYYRNVPTVSTFGSYYILAFFLLRYSIVLLHHRSLVLYQSHAVNWYFREDRKLLNKYHVPYITFSSFLLWHVMTVCMTRMPSCVTTLVVAPQHNEMIYWFSFAGLCVIVMLHIIQNHK